MSVPVLGPMTFAGFAHGWYFLFLFVVLGLVGLYVVVQLTRQRRVLRFANMELLESVAPRRPGRWRHLSAVLLVAALLVLTVAMAGPTSAVWIPRNRAVVMLVIDVSQSMRAADVAPTRMAAAQDAAKQFADELQFHDQPCGSAAGCGSDVVMAPRCQPTPEGTLSASN